MEPFSKLTSRYVVLANANIDTDQIIPARFLKTITRAGLGQHLFAGWRYLADGSANSEFVLNQSAAQDARILVAGDNFGCGSSREHAPWALVDFGFRVVISTAIADIFQSNAQKNGLLPVVVKQETHDKLLRERDQSLTVDLEQQQLIFVDGSRVAFTVEPFARHCLLNGVDELGFLLQQEQAIASFEEKRR